MIKSIPCTIIQIERLIVISVSKERKFIDLIVHSNLRGLGKGAKDYNLLGERFLVTHIGLYIVVSISLREWTTEQMR